MVMPVRITQTRTRRPSAESLNGLFRQVRSTRGEIERYEVSNSSAGCDRYAMIIAFLD
jgi:hypothetical protein